jgi:hypothetical protein
MNLADNVINLLNYEVFFPISKWASLLAAKF